MKNWIVKTEQIKNNSQGLASFARYLLNKAEPSHKNTEIVNLRDVRKAQRRISASYLERKAKRMREGLRGGGVKNLAQSHLLSLPADIPELSDSDWLDLSKRVAINLARDLNSYPQPNNGPPRKDLDPNDIWRVLGAVLHRESGKKPTHLNIVIGNIIKSEFRKDLTQLRASYSIKNSFNEFVLSKTNVNVKDYKPLNPGRDLNYWEYKQLQLTDLFNKYTKQLENWIKYVEQKNESRIKSTENRLRKTFKEIEDLPVSKDLETDKKKFVKKLVEAREASERKAKRKFIF